MFSVFFDNGVNSHKDLWLADANRPGVATPLLVAPANQTTYGSPSWSYDGKYIVFQALNQVTGISFNRIMYLRMDIPSAPPQLLLNEGGSWFSWSPDGTGIVYASHSGVPPVPAIAILTVSKQADGTLSATKTDLRVWTFNDWGVPDEPSWSPDGRHIVFRELRYQNPNIIATRFIIYEKNASGTFDKIQTSPEILGHITGWKPDGQQILIWSFSNSNSMTPTPAELRVYSPLLSAGPTQTPPSLPRLTGNEANWAVWKKAWNSIGVYNPSTGQVSIRNGLSSGKPDLTFTYGPANAYPVFGDWNGDGADTVGVYETSTGRFLLRNTNSTGFADIVFTFGDPGDVPLAGRWTDTSVFDGVGVFRGNGILYLRNSLSTGFSDFYMVFGNPGDRPIAGDWEGNGVESVGIFRASTQRFFLTNVNGNGITYSDLDFLYGGASATDIPLAGDWVSLGQSRVGIYAGGSFNLLEVPNGTSVLIGTPGTATPTVTPPSRYRVSIADTGADAGPGNAIPFVARIGPTYTPIPTISACPWGGTYSNNTCTYSYSRDDAVRYSLKYKSVSSNLFCSYAYPSNTGIVCSGSGNTNCTNYVSQSLLFGGLGMTVSYVDEAIQREKYSWFVATRLFQMPSTTTPTPVAAYERDVNANNWSGAYYQQFPEYIRMLSGTSLTQANYSLSLYPPPGPTQIGFTVPIATAYANLANVYSIQRGDILLLYKPANWPTGVDFLPHNALVVGWGEYVSDWSQILTPIPTSISPVIPTGTITPKIYKTRQDAILSGVNLPVPYVVDNGPTGSYNTNGTGNYTNPRPYYALWWIVPSSGGDSRSRLNSTAIVGYVHVADSISYLVNSPQATPTGTLTSPLKAPLIRPTPIDINPTQLFNGAR